MCTGLQINYPGGSVLGRTMDIEISLDYQLNYIPRNYQFAKDLFNQPLVSRYRMMGLGFNDYIPLKDGINEHGLVGITNEFPEFNLYDKTVDPTFDNNEVTYLRSLDLLNYLLGMCRDVSEVIEQIATIRIAQTDAKGQSVISPPFHYMFTDPSGRNIVLEPKNGQFEVKENPYQVMTNSPRLERQYHRLERFMDPEKPEEVNAVKGLPGGYDPVSRFVRAYYFSQLSLEPSNQSEACAYLYRILNVLSLPVGFLKNRQREDYTATLYISGYDPNTKELFVQDYQNPKVYRVSFEDIVDLDVYQTIPIPENFKTDLLID